MRASYAGRRTDTGSSALVAAATRLGAGYLGLGGAVDGVLWVGPVAQLVDWKATTRSRRTKTQQKLVAAGCPVVFIATEAEVVAVVTMLRAKARVWRAHGDGTSGD